MVAAGSHHTVLLRTDGTADVFGLWNQEASHDFGQAQVPLLPAGLCYTAVAACEKYTVLLRSDGEAFAFGDEYTPNLRNQLQVPPLPAAACPCLWPPSQSSSRQQLLAQLRAADLSFVPRGLPEPIEVINTTVTPLKSDARAR